MHSFGSFDSTNRNNADTKHEVVELKQYHTELPYSWCYIHSFFFILTSDKFIGQKYFYMRSQFLGIVFWRKYSLVCFSLTGYSALRGDPFSLWRFLSCYNKTKFLFLYSFVFPFRFWSLFKTFRVETTVIHVACQKAKVERLTDEKYPKLNHSINSFHAWRHARFSLRANTRKP